MKHVFDIDIARQYGVNAAILLENIGYWIKRNEANRINFYDGNYWTFNSRRAYGEMFPYMSERQIETAFRKLIDAGVVITGRYNELAYDRTLWYALTEKGKSILHFDGMEASKMSDGNQRYVSPIPDINSDIKPDIKPDKEYTPSAPAAGKSPRHKYGQYENVLLSDEDMGKLKAEFPADWEARIERLSEYIASKGAKYKNHLATIRSWARKDAKTGKGLKADGTNGGNTSEYAPGDPRLGDWM